LKQLAEEKRKVLIECVSEVDEELGDLFLMGEEPTVEQLVAAIRRATISNAFAPLFMGSAYKNRGVQLLLDGVVDYLPAPSEVQNVALDLKNEEEPITLSNESNKPLVALAFKLEEGKFRTAYVPSCLSRQH
jgi:elongation factor G